MTESRPAGALLEAVQDLLYACSLQKLVEAKLGKPTSIGQECVEIAQERKSRHEEAVLAVASVILCDNK